MSNALQTNNRSKTGGRVTFPEFDAPLRNDYSFRNRLQVAHHHKNGCKSLIEYIIPDLIRDVVLDYMHLVCIGEKKKELNECVNGKFDKHRVSKPAVDEISRYLTSVGDFIPSLLARKPRSLYDLPRWKATELR